MPTQLRHHDQHRQLLIAFYSNHFTEPLRNIFSVGVSTLILNSINQMPAHHEDIATASFVYALLHYHILLYTTCQWSAPHFSISMSQTSIAVAYMLPRLLQLLQSILSTTVPCRINPYVGLAQSLVCLPIANPCVRHEINLWDVIDL